MHCAGLVAGGLLRGLFDGLSPPVLRENFFILSGSRDEWLLAWSMLSF